MSTGTSHPLAAILTAAAAGRFPPADGLVDVLPPDDDGMHTVIEFTAHSYVLTDRAPADLLAVGAHGFGGCMQADVLRWLAGAEGRIGSVDAVLVAPARTGVEPLPSEPISNITHASSAPAPTVAMSGCSATTTAGC